MATVCVIDDDLLPTEALDVVLATTVEESERLDGLEDKVEENPPRVWLTRCSRKKRDISMLCMAAGRWW